MPADEVLLVIRTTLNTDQSFRECCSENCGFGPGDIQGEFVLVITSVFSNIIHVTVHVYRG
jgi:hypothetical protein